MKNRLFINFVLLLSLSSCYSRHVGEPLLNVKSNVISQELENNKDKDFYMNKYRGGFVGEYKVENKKLCEFKYSKLAYNWFGYIPIVGLFTRDIKIDKHLIIYLDNNNEVIDYKIIGY